MDTKERTTHWENIYESRPFEEVSWYQPTPKTSLDLIDATKPDHSDAIIDIGGGDSYLVDHLLEIGFHDVTVLDISGKAIERAKQRLEERAEVVDWIQSDVVDFEPDRQYDIWHDRAALHFLTDPVDQQKYLEIAAKGIKPGGYLIAGTFAVGGPEKCSGIVVQQYSPSSMAEFFGDYFNPIDSMEIEHTTPTGKTQQFVFGIFQRD